MRLAIRTSFLTMLFLIGLAGMALSLVPLANSLERHAQSSLRSHDWPAALRYPDSSSQGDVDALDILNESSALEPSSVRTKVDVELSTVIATTTWEGPTEHPMVKAVTRRFETVIASSSNPGDALSSAAMSRFYRSLRGALVSLIVIPQPADGGDRTTRQRFGPSITLDQRIAGDRAEVIITEHTPLVDGPTDLIVQVGPGYAISVPNNNIDFKGFEVKHTDEFTVTLINGELPRLLSTNRAIWTSTDEGSVGALRLTSKSGGAPRLDNALSSGRFLVDWADERRPAWLSPTIFGLLGLVPFVIAALWARRPGAPERLRMQVDLLLILMALPSAIKACSALLGLLDGPLRSVNDPVAGESAKALVVQQLRTSGFRGVEFYALLVVLTVGWWVAVRAVIRKSSHDERGSSALLVTALLIVSAAGAFVAWASGTVDMQALGVLCGASAAIALIAASLLAKPFVTAPTAMAAGATSVAVAALVMVASQFGVVDRSLDETVSVIATALLLVMIVLAVSSSIVWTFGPGGLRHALSRLGPAKATGLLAMSVLVAVYLVTPRRPSATDFPSDTFTLRVSDAATFGLRIQELLPLLLAAVIVLELRRLSDVASVDGWRWQDARVAGLVLTLALVFAPTRTFWFVPIVGALGAAAFWLAVGRPFKADLCQPYPALSARLAQVERVTELRRLRRTESDTWRKGLSRVAAGDTELGKVDASVRAVREQIESTLAKPGPSGSVEEIEAEATGYGPGETAWHSGIIATLYSVGIALPWIVLYSNESLTKTDPSGFVALDIGTGLANIIAAWALYGFIIGYFYPMIVGRTGLSKAMTMGVVFISPLLLYKSIVEVPLGRDDWGSVGAWAVILVAHLVILGIFLDYELLRRARLPGSAFFEFRNLRPLASYGSAFAIAIGGVITTALTASLSTVLSAGLSIIVPQQSETPTTGEPTTETTVTTTGQDGTVGP